MAMLDEIILRTSKELNLPEDLVTKTYKAYWRVIRNYIKELPLKEDLTDEEFLKLKPNVNIPSIGKFYITLDRYKRIKKLHNSIIEKKQNASH